MSRARKNRNIQMKFRVNEEEEQQIRKKIEQSGGNLQDFMLACALDKPVINTDGIKEIMPELKRIGNNLNQIAKQCNEEKNVISSLTLSKVGEMQKELGDVWQLLRELAAKPE